MVRRESAASVSISPGLDEEVETEQARAREDETATRSPGNRIGSDV
jgi:hypothetical protein